MSFQLHLLHNVKTSDECGLHAVFGEVDGWADLVLGDGISQKRTLRQIVKIIQILKLAVSSVSTSAVESGISRVAVQA